VYQGNLDAWTEPKVWYHNEEPQRDSISLALSLERGMIQWSSTNCTPPQPSQHPCAVEHGGRGSPGGC